MPAVSHYIAKLQHYRPEEHIVVAIWCEEDIINRAKERGKEVTIGQARDILDLLDQKQDPLIGISWDTLDTFTDYYLEGQKYLEKQLEYTK